MDARVCVSYFLMIVADSGVETCSKGTDTRIPNLKYPFLFISLEHQHDSKIQEVYGALAVLTLL